MQFVVFILSKHFLNGLFGATVGSVLPHLFSFTMSRSPVNPTDSAGMWMRRKIVNFFTEQEGWGFGLVFFF